MSSELIRVASTSGNLDANGEVNSGLARIGPDLIGGVPVALEARLGQAPMTVEQLMSLKAGAVITLETGLADHVDLYLNDVLVARGEIVAVAGKYGVRIVELAPRL